MLSDPESLLTKPEGARSLRICVRKLESLMKARQISFVKIGKSVRIDRAELERFKAAYTVKALE